MKFYVLRRGMTKEWKKLGIILLHLQYKPQLKLPQYKLSKH